MSGHLIAHKKIEQKIFLVRRLKVMMDYDLSRLYDVTTGNLNKAVKRNFERFPKDFMFQLSRQEYNSLRFQFGILEKGQHSKYLPYAFTQNGVAMLSSVLNSRRAIEVNIQIMRAFTKLRELASTHKDVYIKLKALENQCLGHSRKLKIVFQTLKQILEAPAQKPPEIPKVKGFVRQDK